MQLCLLGFNLVPITVPFFDVATQLWEEHSYIVWANNSGGSSFTIVNLSVVDQVPNLTYAIDKLELVNNTINMSMPLLPTLTGPGEITSWAINATLPAGIQFGAGNGTFWGVPTELCGQRPITQSGLTTVEVLLRPAFFWLSWTNYHY